MTLADVEQGCIKGFIGSQGALKLFRSSRRALTESLMRGLDYSSTTTEFSWFIDWDIDRHWIALHHDYMYKAKQ